VPGAGSFEKRSDRQAEAISPRPTFDPDSQPLPLLSPAQDANTWAFGARSCALLPVQSRAHAFTRVETRLVTFRAVAEIRDTRATGGFFRR
jgi:hypothetical protein